jgi:ribosomal-protein-alanine N-acetyltransferase
VSVVTEAAQVRPAEPADAAALAVLDGLVNLSPWTLAQLEAACAKGTNSTERTLLVEQAGQVLGFVIYTQVLDEACIHNIAVQPSQQGRGHGRSLLCSALAAVQRDGASRCYLEVRASNAAARALYEKFSFQCDGLRRDYYAAPDGREDAVLMSRSL